MLKENKKLASKVESLNRKVQNLQSKLAAAKASALRAEPSMPNGMALPTEATLAPRALSATSSVPSVPPVPTHSPPPIIRAPSHRIASGPSSLSRPKTPERRVPVPPVFKARTPERRVASAAPPDAMLSATTIGKKRPAPDDFEHCEGIPPQGFTIESLPSHGLENEIPRLRRVLSNIQSGFTPVRHSARPTIPLPSPKRPIVDSARSSPLIADVTNSPRAVSQMMTGQSGKPSKRSWLGKIRGVSTQATGRDTRG
jgi:myosin protein heavy chain